MTPRLSTRAALSVAALLALTACGGDDDEAAAPSSPSSTSSAPSSSGAPAVSGAVTVFAAASLTGAFEEIGTAFEAAHPGTTVTFNFGGSSALAQQIVSGAPADVFAAASPTTMTTVTDAGDAGPTEVFVRNRLEIAVPADNPGAVTGVADFAKDDLTIALCAPEVPCGSAAAKVFAAAGITAQPDTLEQDVKAALTKVTLGEVDAAMVYRTDVLAAGDAVRGIEFPEAEQAINDYPIATLSAAPHAAAAQAFVAYVLSSAGQEVLAAAGFDHP